MTNSLKCCEYLLLFLLLTEAWLLRSQEKKILVHKQERRSSSSSRVHQTFPDETQRDLSDSTNKHTEGFMSDLAEHFLHGAEKTKWQQPTYNIRSGTHGIYSIVARRYMCFL